MTVPTTVDVRADGSIELTVASMGPVVINVTPGRKQTVTERGWYAPPYTACRFAVLAQIALRMGYDVPLARTPQGAPNMPYMLQLAGDNTPGNGSTMRQGQLAVRTCLPGAPYLFGAMTKDELLQAVRDGATVGFTVKCSLLPRYLRRFCGYRYNGGHYMAVDWVDDVGLQWDLSDPMYRPARAAKVQRVPVDDVWPAIGKDGQGRALVSLGYQDAGYASTQLDLSVAKVKVLEAQLANAQAEVSALATDLDEARAEQASWAAKVAAIPGAG